MDEINIYQKKPFVQKVKPGVYAWCACGRSSKNPFCDGSHKDSNIRPVIERVESEKTIAWCGCKYSEAKPHCDGSHCHL
jgi:CDGSH-type Zn-finger protein